MHKRMVLLLVILAKCIDFARFFSLCFFDVVVLYLVFIKLFPVNFMGKGVFVAENGGF